MTERKGGSKEEKRVTPVFQSGDIKDKKNVIPWVKNIITELTGFLKF